MRKLSIPYTKDNKILDIMDSDTLKYVNEIYMPLPYDIMPSGRVYMANEYDVYKTMFDTQLQKAKDIDLKVNILASKPILDIDNGITLITRTVRELERIRDRFNVAKVTIGSLTFLKLYGKYIKDLGYEIELSVLANIDTYEKIDQVMTVHPYIDSICVYNSLMHDLEQLNYIKKKYRNLKLKILVNHLCMYKCASHVEHHNTYSNIIINIKNVDTTNLSEWRLASNANQLLPNCKLCIYYSNEHLINPIKETSFIRPEDLHVYDTVIDLFKLSGREHPSENIIKWVKAYGERVYDGNLLDIVDSPMSINSSIDNKAFPEDYIVMKSKCEHKCYKCGYCDTIIRDNNILTPIQVANNPQ